MVFEILRALHRHIADIDNIKNTTLPHVDLPEQTSIQLKNEKDYRNFYREARFYVLLPAS